MQRDYLTFRIWYITFGAVLQVDNTNEGSVLVQPIHNLPYRLVLPSQWMVLLVLSLLPLLLVVW